MPARTIVATESPKAKITDTKANFGDHAWRTSDRANITEKVMPIPPAALSIVADLPELQYSGLVTLQLAAFACEPLHPISDASAAVYVHTPPEGQAATTDVGRAWTSHVL